MKTLLELAGGIAGIALLYYGADYLIKGCVGIARKLHIPELVIGLTLVAFGTSAPRNHLCSRNRAARRIGLRLRDFRYYAADNNYRLCRD